MEQSITQESTQIRKDVYGGLDIFRILAAVLVVTIHTSPLASIHEDADFFLTRVLARIAVPFFLMVTGQFLLSDIGSPDKRRMGKRMHYIQRVLILYGISTLLYLPIGIYAGHYQNLSVGGVLRMIFFDGTFYHLWYFPACVIGILIVTGLQRCKHKVCMVSITGGLYVIGLLGDSYYGVLSHIPALENVYQYGFTVWSYTRNGLFFTPLFLMLGALLGLNRMRLSRTMSILGFVVSLILLTIEAYTVRRLGWQRHDSMYLMLPVVMLFLYHFLQSVSLPSKPFLRGVSTWLYVLHPAVIVAVHAAANVLHFPILIENSLVNFTIVIVVSGMLAVLLSWLIGKGTQSKDDAGNSKGRAWIELDRDALKKNVEFLQAQLPPDCKLMPAIKANAYGHGAVLMAKMLSQMGIDSFCVACIQEGIELRKADVQGSILILGYTSPEQFDLLRKYHLTQTVVDYAYAKELEAYGKTLHVHIGIDTGMHRLGERSENLEDIKAIFDMKNLVVEGMYTHLSADDTRREPDRLFTYHQAEAFYHVAETLSQAGIPCPKLHLQASYGVLNYPELSGDYARVGIVLYGILSTKEDTEPWKKKLYPVLSLKARVASVRMIQPGESAGYGNPFVAEKYMKIATLAIGYADGLPRALSNGNGGVLVNGIWAPILGRICMDQTLIDISGIPNVQAGDVVVLIGISGNEEISACDVAAQTGTITNEILSRMGKRLERIVV